MKYVFELLEQEINRYQKSIETLSVLFDATKDEGIQSSLMRDVEYQSQFKRAYEILLNSDMKDKRSVATEE